MHLTLLALLQALCEEVTFRGFILRGLERHAFRPWTALLLSAFLFALFQMNVFQALPHFLLGVLMGFLVQRTGSLWPAVLFHFCYNALVYNIPPAAGTGTWYPEAFAAAIEDPEGGLTALAVVAGVAHAAVAAGILVLIAAVPPPALPRRAGRPPARRNEPTPPKPWPGNAPRAAVPFVELVFGNFAFVVPFCKGYPDRVPPFPFVPSSHRAQEPSHELDRANESQRTGMRAPLCWP